MVRRRQPGHPEVEHLGRHHLTRVEEDILRLEVAMDHPAIVRGSDCGTDGDQNRGDVTFAEAAR